MTQKVSPPTTQKISSVHCSEPRDLVAATPYLLGYTVSRSVVAILFHHKRSKGAFRISLPEKSVRDSSSSSTLGSAAEISSTLSDMIRELTDIDEVALLYYTDETIGDPKNLPGADLISLCRRELAGVGRNTVETICVSPTRWASYADPDQTPWGGFDTAELGSSNVALECTTKISRPIHQLSKVCQLPRVEQHTVENIQRSCTHKPQWPREAEEPKAQQSEIENVEGLWSELLSVKNFSQMPHRSVAKLIGALQHEEHWFHAATLAATGFEQCSSLLRTSFERHGLSTREFLMRAPSGKLFGSQTREQILCVTLFELGKENQQREHLHLFCERTALLAATAPERLRKRIEALRAYAWWLLGMASIAVSVLGQTEPHAHRRGSACVIHAVTDLLNQHQHPEWILRFHRSQKVS